MINKIVWKFIIMFLLTGTNNVWAQISFESILKSDIELVVKKFPKSKYSSSVDIGNQIIKYLRQTNRYEKISLLRSRGNLIITG